MANPTSSRPWPFRTTRRLAFTAIGGVLAILVVAGTVTLTTLNLRHVHASGTGPGGGCYPTSGPVCTFKGHNATAQFESSSDCVITDVYVLASDSFSRSGGSAAQSSYINVNTFSYNMCTGDSSSGWGSDTGTVQLSPSGDRLTAQGNVVVYIYSYSGSGGTSAGTLGGSGTGGGGTSSTVNYTVNLTWKSFGAPSSQVTESHYQSPGFVTNMHFTGTSQNAVVSGTLSDGTTNFAATPSAFGESISASSGTFVVIQK